MNSGRAIVALMLTGALTGPGADAACRDTAGMSSPFWLCDTALPKVVETGSGESRLAAVAAALASLAQAQHFSVRPLDSNAAEGVTKTLLYRQFGPVEFQGMITSTPEDQEQPEQFQYVYKVSLETDQCEFEYKRLVAVVAERVTKNKTSMRVEGCGTAEVLAALETGGVTLLDEHYDKPKGETLVLIGYEP